MESRDLHNDGHAPRPSDSGRIAQAQERLSQRDNVRSSGLPFRTNRLGAALFFAACVIASFTCALFLELFLEVAALYQTGVLEGLLGSATPFSTTLRLGLLFAIFLLIMLVFWRSRLVFEWVIDHRIVIGIVVLAFCVIFQISGSSIAMWGDMLGGERLNGTLFGIPRSIRSDEWNVFTPFAFSQAWTGYAATSELLRGGATDVTMVYGQPAWSLSTLFRPFLWGYLVLGSARGLSFFWCARLIALFLMTYELGLIVARGDKYLAAFMAVLVTFSPAVQWWFAVNGTAELFIFGQGLVVALHRFLRTGNARGRWLHAAILAWFLGCYAFILYPATQIPCAYVFAALGLADLIAWRRERRANREHERSGSVGAAVLSLAVCVVAVVGLCVVAVLHSRETIELVTGTVYPGERMATGGGYAVLILNQFCTLVSPISADAFIPNACEAATFIGLFPIGIVLCCIFGLKRRDVLTICMLVVGAFLWIYALVGFPAALAKVTLMSNCNLARLVYALGFLDIAFLVRALALRDEASLSADHSVSRPQRSSALGLLTSFVVAIALALAVTVLGRYLNVDVMGKWQCLVTFLTFAGLIFSVVAPASIFALPSPARGRHSSEGASGTTHATLRGQFLLAFSLVVVISGLCVNPIQRGADALLESDYVALVESVAQTEDTDGDDVSDGLWVADSTVLAQAAVQGGAPVLNTVNTYPNLETWRTIDPTGAYSDIYNRYAYINVVPTLEPTSFELIQPDVFQLNINPDDLAKLGVTDFISMTDLTAFDTETTRFVPVASEGSFTVYRVESV